MTWRRWVSFALVSGAVSFVATPARAQLAPTGGHYAARASDTGYAGAVNSSGGYGAAIPLDLPAARGNLPVPVEIVYGEHGVGAAGRGWDVNGFGAQTRIRYRSAKRDSSTLHQLPFPEIVVDSVETVGSDALV